MPPQQARGAVRVVGEQEVHHRVRLVVSAAAQVGIGPGGDAGAVRGFAGLPDGFGQDDSRSRDFLLGLVHAHTSTVSGDRRRAESLFARRQRRAYAPELEVPDGAEDEVLLEADDLLDELLDVPLDEVEEELAGPVGVGAPGVEGTLGVVGAPGVLGLLGVLGIGVLGVLGAEDPCELAGLVGVELPESCEPLCAASACFTIATKSALCVPGIGATSTEVPQAL